MFDSGSRGPGNVQRKKKTGLYIKIYIMENRDKAQTDNINLDLTLTEQFEEDQQHKKKKRRELTRSKLPLKPQMGFFICMSMFCLNKQDRSCK